MGVICLRRVCVCVFVCDVEYFLYVFMLVFYVSRDDSFGTFNTARRVRPHSHSLIEYLSFWEES